MKARIVAASLASVLLAAGAAQAAGPHGGHHDGARMEKFFERMDTDKDGRLTKEEMAGSNDLFAKADEDGDGALSAAEYNRYRELKRAARAERKFARLDEDGDGKLSPQELNARRDARFERMDQNGDGALTKEEIREGMKKWHDKDRQSR